MTAERCEAIRLEGMEQYGFGPNAMKKIKVCDVCGTIARADETVCDACGEMLPQETVFQQYKKRHLHCTHCETIVSPGMRYCPQCGARLNNGPQIKVLK